MVSIFTYDFPVATAAFEKAGIQYHSLTNYPVLIRLTVSKGVVSADQEDILLKWHDDTDNWKGVL